MDVEHLRDKLKVSEEELKLSRQLYEHEVAEKDEIIHHLNMQLESALTDVDIIRKDDFMARRSSSSCGLA